VEEDGESTRHLCFVAKFGHFSEGSSIETHSPTCLLRFCVHEIAYAAGDEQTYTLLSDQWSLSGTRFGVPGSSVLSNGLR
jgi:hypothetical protein